MQRFVHDRLSIPHKKMTDVKGKMKVDENFTIPVFIAQVT